MISVSTITIKSNDPRATARFWRDLLGYSVGPNHSSSILLAADGRPSLLIQPSDEPQGDGAIHLDLRPTDHAAAVEHALALGARRVDIGQRGDEGWTVLADPTGNVFCILETADAEALRLEHDPGSPTPID